MLFRSPLSSWNLVFYALAMVQNREYKGSMGWLFNPVVMAFFIALFVGLGSVFLASLDLSVFGAYDIWGGGA